MHKIFSLFAFVLLSFVVGNILHLTNTMYLIFSTREQLTTIRAECQTGNSSIVAPQKCMRLFKGIITQITQQPQSGGAII